MRSIKLLPSFPFASPSPHHGQLLTLHYAAISLALPHTELRTAKHTDKLRNGGRAEKNGICS